MDEPIRILVLGASYGLLPGIKLALAGHKVTFVGRHGEIEAMAKSPLEVEIPLRKSDEVVSLRAEVADLAAPLTPALRPPAETDPAEHDFVLLAMQEPHFAAPEIAGLVRQIAKAEIPCLSIMNLPPPCYLDRLGSIPLEAQEGVYSSGDVWRQIDPDRISLACPDAQALRMDPQRPGHLTVTLPSNFKAAPFARQQDQVLLERLARDMSRLKCVHGEARVRPPVMLLAVPSLFAPLAKWPMLIAGNYRCLVPGGIRTISQAVHDDPLETRKVYDQVLTLIRQLGTPERAMVGFDEYSKAARRLVRPSSVARGLAGGARQVERVDRLVLNLLRYCGLEAGPVEEIVAAVDRGLAQATS